ncbi:hypothetical protein OQA88_11653 [Cercophora sp. LCS_1]
MLFTKALSAVAFAAFAAAAPAAEPRSAPVPRFSIPTDDGFPTPNAEQLKVINDLADGTLSNAPPPAKINETSFTVFQLTAFNENFEVAFFSSLLHNVTTSVPGFEVRNQKKRDELIDILETVLAQEKLHAINAANVLRNFKVFIPQPCRYQFPSTNVYEAISLAERFTAIALGNLQDAIQTLARNGDVGPVRGVASSLGQEGQQSGFYRILLSKKPSEKPFLTTNTAAFAYSALQQFIVPGSCDYELKEIKLPIFTPLNVISGKGGAAVEARDQHLSFHADFTGVAAADAYIGKQDGLWITYFTGQRVPFGVPITNAKWTGRSVTFEASFPYTENVMEGLSIASLTTKSTFANPAEVVAAALAAPGLIQVDDRVKSWDGFKL